MVSSLTGPNAFALSWPSSVAANGAADVDSALVLNTTYYLGLLALACDAAGATAEARGSIDAAVSTGERWFDRELHRLKGEWLLRYAPGGEISAETAFRPIGLAAQQGALLWELRASVDLAQLQLARGEPVRALETLA
jgi:predicted ATPase